MAWGTTELILKWGIAGGEELLRIVNPDHVLREDPQAEEFGRLVRDGVWPGIRRPANQAAIEAEVASASSEPWVDSNGYLVEYFRALDGSRPVWLAQRPANRPDVDVPLGTVELALIEARLAGGNFLVELPERYQARLLAGDAKALAAWKQLGLTARWLKEQASLFGLTPLPQIVALVEPGLATREIANLLHRRGASPVLRPAGAAIPSGMVPVAMVAAGLKAVPEQAYAFASRGGMLVTDQAVPLGGRLVREDVDRNFYQVGAGKLVAYRKRVADPSEFALDVIDLITHKRRATRLWNAPSVIPVATAGASAGEAILRLVNYGEGEREEVQAHVQGHFAKATFLSPGRMPSTLKVARRGASTEVFVPKLERVGIVRFSN